MSNLIAGGPAASEALLAARHEIAEAVVALEFSANPGLEVRYGSQAREKSREDIAYHLAFLAQALALENATLFSDYVAWVKVVLVRRGVSGEHLADHLGCLARVLDAHLAPAPAQAAKHVVEAALEMLPGMPDDTPTFVDASAPLSALVHRYLQALLSLDRDKAAAEIREAMAAGVSRESVCLDVLAVAQREIGRLWQINQASVGQEHFSTSATQSIMAQAWSGAPAKALRAETMVAACVAGDLHDLGLRMVADFFAMSGWKTIYLGASTPHRDVVATLHSSGATVLAISATIGFHLTAVRALIALVRADSRLDGVRILVGGRPFDADPGLWQSVGADGHAANARLAVELASRWVDGDPARTHRAKAST